MKITDISVDRPVFASMIFVALIVLGMVSLSKMSVDLFPDIEFPVAIVITEYKAAGPKEVESMVTRPLEESLASINNVDTITSITKEGNSLITIKFTWGTDMSLAVADIRERIEMTKKILPDDIETPIVFKFDISMMPVMILAVSGNRDNAYIREYAEDNIKNMLERADGVAAARVMGGIRREVKVDLVKNRMDAYGLSIDSIIMTLAAENMDIAGGDVKSMHKKFSIRSKGEFKSLNDMRSVVVAIRNNTPVYLRDIANIYEGPAERKEAVRLNGEQGVILMINKQSDKNTVLVARNIYNKIKEIKETLPPDMDINIFMDQAEFIERSIDNVTSNAIQGGVIAILVILVLLRNFRAAIIIGVSIPISIITTYIAMYYAGITLNIMSMGGLALGVGMLVDNAIVSLENIFRFRERGARNTEAAKLGADEIAMPIAASTMTTIVVFVPFLFTTGLSAQLFRQMALTVTFSLLCSLLVAITLVPMLTSNLMKTLHVVHTGRLSFLNTIYDASESTLKWLDRVYSVALEWALNNRKKTVLIVAGSLISAVVLMPITGMEFMPEQDEARITIDAELPVGTNLDTTERVLMMCEERIKKALSRDEYKAFSIRAGYGEGFAAAFGGTTDHSGRIEIRLVMKSERKRTQEEIRRVFREAFVDIPGVTFNFMGGRMGALASAFGMGAQISIEIYGYDFEQAEKYSNAIADAIKTVPGLKDINISTEHGLPEYVIRINREKASRAGLSAAHISSVLKDYMAGRVATRYRKEGKEYDVTVRLREEDRKRIDDIKSLMVQSPLGRSIPLGNLVEITRGSGPATIERQRQERVTYIGCMAEGRDLNSVVGDIKERINKVVKPPNFSVNIAGAYKDMQETFRDLILAFILAIVLIYIIMAMQFESYYLPFVVMFSVPTVLFGVIVFLFLTGTTINVVSFMGVIILAGVVVNNAIVLVDYVSILRKRGRSLREALIEGGRTRLRPIMGTTLTTLFGLLPMVLGFGEGAELTRPLARAFFGGLTTGFIFTLIFVPVVYSVLETLRDRWLRRKAV